jgi:glutamine amidotransferase
MQKMSESGLIDVLNEKVLVDKIPILGICLGMQLMTNSSEEGKLQGLGWIDAEVVKFKEVPELKVPHMGWNYTTTAKENPLLFSEEKMKFYYVHSFFVRCHNELDILATCDYGVNFHAAFNHENIFGMQFHPEKSLKYGMEVFKKFANM